jgi:hypothetical protein
LLVFELKIGWIPWIRGYGGAVGFNLFFLYGLDHFCGIQVGIHGIQVDKSNPDTKKG